MLDYTIFGESHGPAVGVLVTGAAPGLSLIHISCCWLPPWYPAFWPWALWCCG